MGYRKRKGTVAARHYPAQLDSGRLPAELIDDLYVELDVYIDTDYRVGIRKRGCEWLLSLDDTETCDYILGLHQERLEVYLSTAFLATGATLYAPRDANRLPAAPPAQVRLLSPASEPR